MKNKETNQEENVIGRSIKRFLGNSTTFSKEEQKAIVLALEIGEAYEQLILKLQKYESKMRKRKNESPNAGDEILENTVMYGINGMTNCLQEIFAMTNNDFGLSYSIIPFVYNKEIEDVEGYCSEPWEVSFDHADSIYAHNFIEQDTTANNCTGNLDRPDTIATNCTGDIVINDKYGVFDKD